MELLRLAGRRAGPWHGGGWERGEGVMEGWHWGLPAHVPAGFCWAAGASQPQKPNRGCPHDGEPHPACPGSLRVVRCGWCRTPWRKGALCHTDRPWDPLHRGARGFYMGKCPASNSLLYTLAEKTFPGFHSPSGQAPAPLPCPLPLMHPLGYQRAQPCPGEMPRRNQTLQAGDALKPPTAAFSPLFQGSNAEASLPHGRALWDHRLTPQQLRAEQPPS